MKHQPDGIFITNWGNHGTLMEPTGRMWSGKWKWLDFSGMDWLLGIFTIGCPSFIISVYNNLQYGLLRVGIQGDLMECSTMKKWDRTIKWDFNIRSWHFNHSNHVDFTLTNEDWIWVWVFRSTHLGVDQSTAAIEWSNPEGCTNWKPSHPGAEFGMIFPPRIFYTAKSSWKCCHVRNDLVLTVSRVSPFYRFILGISNLYLKLKLHLPSFCGTYFNNYRLSMVNLEYHLNVI